MGPAEGPSEATRVIDSVFIFAGPTYYEGRIAAAGACLKGAATHYEFHTVLRFLLPFSESGPVTFGLRLPYFAPGKLGRAASLRSIRINFRGS